MADIKFGGKYKELPTPSSVSDRIDLWSKIFGVTMPAVTAAPFIPQGVSDIIVYVLGFAITVLQIMKPYYGINTAAMIPQAEVETIKDDNETK